MKLLHAPLIATHLRLFTARAPMAPKRTLEAFFTVQKRVKSGPNATYQQETTSATHDACDQTSDVGGAVSAAAVASQQATWGSASPVATVTTAAAAAAQPEDAGGVDRPVAAEPESMEEEAAPTAEMLAKWHEEADRNLDAAQAAVAATAAAGKPLRLADLLVEPSWQARLGPEFQKQYFKQLQGFLHSEWHAQSVYPPPGMIFRAMNSTPFDKVKVVILGQDPYHNTGQAMGLSFSVPKGTPVPSSLQNIYKELNADLGCTRPSHGCLLKWAEQGVLLLNASLTVRAHTANSHAKKGWQSFTDEAISCISKRRKGVVFILWGAAAQNKAKLINAGKHHILKSAHPSGLSAHKGFFGSKPFSSTNELLAESGMAPIDWQIEYHDSADSVKPDSDKRLSSDTSGRESDPLRGHPRYTRLVDINRGSSGFVQLAEDTATGERVAIKFIPRLGFDELTVAREVLNQRACALHPNIIQLQEVFLTDHHLAIVMEYADGGNLSQCIDDLKRQGVRGMAEADARKLFQQLLVALEACHARGVANRDIKLDNILLHGDWPAPVVKICDFGYSKDESVQSYSKSTCGTPEYMAPEVLFEDCYDGKAADVWSAGVALYVMLTGTFPFKRPCDKTVPKVVAMQRMFQRIIRAEYSPVPQVSEDARELLNWMLQPDVEMRAALSEVMTCSWFQDGLPPGLVNLNAVLARSLPADAPGGGGASCRQTPEQLLALVAAAGRRPSADGRA